MGEFLNGTLRLTPFVGFDSLGISKGIDSRASMKIPKESPRKAEKVGKHDYHVEDLGRIPIPTNSV